MNNRKNSQKKGSIDICDKDNNYLYYFDTLLIDRDNCKYFQIGM